MADFVIVDGDQAIFQPGFGPVLVVVQPGRITGSGTATVGGAKLCVAGDEASVVVPNCPYTQASFIGGTGTLAIQQLAPDQQAKTTTNGAAPILKGSQFVASFQVDVPGTDPASGAPGPKASFPGQGSFTTVNSTVTAS